MGCELVPDELHEVGQVRSARVNSRDRNLLANLLAANFCDFGDSKRVPNNPSVGRDGGRILDGHDRQSDDGCGDISQMGERYLGVGVAVDCVLSGLVVETDGFLKAHDASAKTPDLC